MPGDDLNDPTARARNRREPRSTGAAKWKSQEAWDKAHPTAHPWKRPDPG